MSRIFLFTKLFKSLMHLFFIYHYPHYFHLPPILYLFFYHPKGR